MVDGIDDIDLSSVSPSLREPSTFEISQVESTGAGPTLFPGASRRDPDEMILLIGDNIAATGIHSLRVLDFSSSSFPMPPLRLESYFRGFRENLGKDLIERHGRTHLRLAFVCPT